MKDTEWAYLAGIIDGEGCITSYRNTSGSYYIRIRVAQRNPAIINWLMTTVGGRSWASHKRCFDKPGYTWGIECGKARPVIKGIYPYLTLKKKQAEVAWVLGKVPRIPKERQAELHQLLKDLKVTHDE